MPDGNRTVVLDLGDPGIIVTIIMVVILAFTVCYWLGKFIINRCNKHDENSTSSVTSTKRDENSTSSVTTVVITPGNFVSPPKQTPP